MLPLPLPLLVGTGHTSCSSYMRAFFRGGMHSYHPLFFPRCWRPLRGSSPSSRLGPLVVDLCPVGCGRGVGGGPFFALCLRAVWVGAPEGWRFLCVCGCGCGGVSRIPSLPCSVPSPPWFPAPFLLVHAREVPSEWQPCSCSPYLVSCGRLCAFVHVLSSPASFSPLAPLYLFASSRRLSCVRVQLHCILCFACGGLYACV